VSLEDLAFLFSLGLLIAFLAGYLIGLNQQD
jgi:hypothetical protein